MKLNKIKALCKAAKRSILYDELGKGGDLRRQWIGTGSGIYLLDGLPILGPANIPPLMGLEGNAVSKIKVTLENLPPEINTEDYNADEPALAALPCIVSVGGTDLALFRGGYQVWALDEAELAPALNTNCTVKMRWTPAGAPYFTVFHGMFLEAILFRERSYMLDETSRTGLGIWLNWLKPAEERDEK